MWLSVLILPITAFYIRAPGSVGYERAAFTALSLDVLLTGALPARRAPPATPGVHTCPPHDPPPGDSAPPGRASRYTNRDASLYDYTRIMRNTTAGEVASRLDLASSLDRPHELEYRGEHELVPLAVEHRDTMVVHVARREGGHDVPARARGARALSSTPRPQTLDSCCCGTREPGVGCRPRVSGPWLVRAPTCAVQQRVLA